MLSVMVVNCLLLQELRHGTIDIELSVWLSH